MKRTLLTVDNVMQSIFLVSGIFFPFTLVAAFLLGCWQLGSSLLKAIFLRSRLHLNYFLAAAAYCMLLIVGLRTADAFDYEPSTWLGYLWFVLALPPLVGGIWYFLQSIKDLDEIESTQSRWV